MYDKKGQMGGAVGAIIQLVTGVGVAVLVLIFVGALSGQTYNLVESDIDSIGVTAEDTLDLTVLNSTAVNLDHTILQAAPVATQAGEVVTGNFTYDLPAGTATLIDNANNNTAFNFTYSYKDTTVSSSVKNGVISGFQALEQTGDYLPIIVLAVVISLVLFLILGMTSGVNKGGGKNTAL
jgi:hypothetical protein